MMDSKSSAMDLEDVKLSRDDDNRSTRTDLTRAESSAFSTSFSAKWSRTIMRLHHPVVRALLWISNKSALNPRRTMSVVALLSIALAVIGLFTNFNVDIDEDKLWTPASSRVLKHSDWINDGSGYPDVPRFLVLFFHSDTNNVLGQEQVGHIFSAVDVVRGLSNYDSTCALSDTPDRYGVQTCSISGVTTFWNDTADQFASSVSTDAEAIEQMSARTYPDGTPVSQGDIFGLAQRDDSDILTSVQSYTVAFDLPDDEKSEELEEKAIDALIDLADRWDADSTISLRLEVNAERSFGDEFERAILNDIPLLPVVFTLMSIFCCIVFFKRDKVRSRTLLGFNAVVAVFLSIVSGFGLLFICGVPFTSMTQILPFVIFGIGLDDAFIIAGAYDRTNKEKDAVERIRETIEDVGASITLTTLSTTLAFLLGSTSTIPAVFWLCYYAVPTVIFVFLYQITFFVACIVLDTRRQEQGRRDCCVWASANRGTEAEDQHQLKEQISFFDRLMERFANVLLKPSFQIPVVLAFMGLLGACTYSATKLTQEFRFTDVLPSDSYVADFQNARDANTARSVVAPFAYFRYVDQSDPSMRSQMDKYISDLVNIEGIVDPPERVWFKDFEVFVNSSDFSDLDFNEQIERFLSDPVNGELYGDHIVRDQSGTVTTSRVRLFMDNVDIEDVTEQIDALADQRDVSEAQPANLGRGDNWAFFTYDGPYNIWEFYTVVGNELFLTTILGVTSVTAITLLFVPHWSAAFFVLPLICILYVDLLGLMQFAGVHINAVSYISLVMSIGLMVDFLLHVLFRYYESEGNRQEKVVYTLKTMGASVLVGGISTFLGTLPLAFSTSTIFSTIFISFVFLVLLGCAHGLILMPILLSRFGSEDQVFSEKARKETKQAESNEISDSLSDGKEKASSEEDELES